MAVRFCTWLHTWLCAWLQCQCCSSPLHKGSRYGRWWVHIINLVRKVLVTLLGKRGMNSRWGELSWQAALFLFCHPICVSHRWEYTWGKSTTKLYLQTASSPCEPHGCHWEHLPDPCTQVPTMETSGHMKHLSLAFRLLVPPDCSRCRRSKHAAASQRFIHQWWCISVLESWKETHLFCFIYKFPKEHSVNPKCPTEFLWMKSWDTMGCIYVLVFRQPSAK